MSFLKKWATSRPSPPVAQTVGGPPPAVQDRYKGPERGLPALPNELIPVVLGRLDGRSLYRVAQVSRRFNELSTRAWLAQHGITPNQLASGHVVIQSLRPVEAFVALRTALFLRARPLCGLTCRMLFVDAAIITQLDAMMSFFSPPRARLTYTELDFGANMVPKAEKTRAVARALTQLVCTLTSDCSVTVVVLKDGLFTCRPDALRRWSPATGRYEGGWAESSYASVHMHDGSRQRVPTIRAFKTLSVQYPLGAPHDAWKLVVVDAAALTDLQLTITLAPHEWDAILDGLTLPALACVGLWASAIRTATSARFLSRHERIRTLKYMSPTADALPPGCAPLRLPQLQTLNTLVPYLLHVFAPAPAADGACEEDAAAAASRFPRLALIELRPHALLPDALHLLARTHAPLRALALWSLLPADFAAAWWSPLRFPAVRVLTLNECRVIPAPAALLARVFPALAKVEVNHSWASRGDVSRRQIEREQRAFVEQVKAANPGVHTVIFDGKQQAV